MGEVTPGSGAGLLPGHRRAPFLHAGFWRRAIAWLVDLLIAGIFVVVLILFFGTWLLLPSVLLGGPHGVVAAKLIDASLLPFGLMVTWLYYAVCESSRWQATPGKLVFGLAVTDESGGRIGFRRATVRFFAKFISLLSLGAGFALAGWSVCKQALHDFMARCCVVRKSGLLAWRDESGAQPEAALTHALDAPPRTPGWTAAMIVTAGAFCAVLPVLVIFAWITLPAYASHAVRVEVAQGVELTTRPRALIAEYIGQRGALPDSNADLGLPRPEAIQARYVTSMRIAGGKVVVTYGNQASPSIRGGHVVIAPEGSAAMLSWDCSSPDIDESYLPAMCHR